MSLSLISVFHPLLSLDLQTIELVLSMAIRIKVQTVQILFLRVALVCMQIIQMAKVHPIH
jgi:hypothetical protein